MDEEKRNAIAYAVASRVANNLQRLANHDEQVAYLINLVKMLDDTHLIALEFSILMTPDSTNTPQAQ